MIILRWFDDNGSTDNGTDKRYGKGKTSYLSQLDNTYKRKVRFTILPISSLLKFLLRVDVLDQEVTQLRHKKRRKRKTRSGKKKHQIKSKPIRVQATRGDIRRKSPVRSPHPVVVSPDVIVPNAA